MSSTRQANISCFLNTFVCGCFLVFVNLGSVCFAEPGIRIVEPLDGALFAPAEKITFTVESVGGFDLEQVLIGLPGDSKIIYTAPFSIDSIVPDKAIGSMIIMAVGKSPLKQFAMDEVTIIIQPNATLQLLTAGSMEKIRVTKSGSERTLIKFYLSEESSPEAMIVKGLYSDGITRDLRPADTGTTYVSNDPEVVTVDESGMVTVQGVGATTITVSNSGVSTEVPVNVKKKWVSLADKETIPPTTEIDIAPLANIAGWHNVDLTITLTAVDNEDGSGVKEINYGYSGAVNENQTVTGNEVVLNFSTEGMTILSYYATDNAGNNESQKTYEIKLDKILPDVVAPVLDSVYEYNSQISINYSASDLLSGIASVSGILNGSSIENGATVILTQLGNNNFTLKATDYADNVAVRSIDLNVEYDFSGFLPPVVADGSKVYKQGQTLPVKFQLQDADQNYISTAKATLTLQQYSEESPVGEPIEVESTSGADVGNTFRYDSDDEQYIYNLNTKSLSSGVWQLQVHFDDGTIKTGLISLK